MKAETFTPNPHGDEEKGWALIPVCWALVLCALVSTILRVYIPARLTRNLGWDDTVMVVTMCTTVVGAGLVTGEVVNGLGRHMYYLTTSQRTDFQAIAWGDWVQVFITLGLTKISICLFLLRIVDSRRVVQAMWGIIGFTALFSSVCVFLFLGVCRPLNAYWIAGKTGTCMSRKQVETIVIAHGVLSILADLVCAALPAIFLRNLQINRRTKIGLCTLMGLGVITAICCIVRTSLSGALTDPDESWATVTNAAWRIPEVNIGIVCANAPVLRPLYLFFRGRLQSQRVAAMTNDTNNTASKERIIWPSNVKRGNMIPLGSSETWHKPSAGSQAAEAEMGLPVRAREAVEGPLREKPYFSLGSGR